MGVVWRAFDIRLQRWVAIKGVRSASKGSQERLVREARLLARLQHPSLVQVYDLISGPAPDRSGDLDRSWWLVMEFVEGETLAQRVRSGNRLEIEEVLQLGVALAGGLAEAHAYGLVHRDLSSSNVIIPVRGTPKILDFGLAARVEGGAEGTKNPGLPETVKSILGTPGFIAPERMEGVTSDRRSDLYGLGAVLFFALTGQRPVADETPVGDKDGRRSAGRGRTLMHLDVQRLRPDGPPSLAAFIEELLSPDPWDRVQSAESAERELKAIERARLPARSSSGVANPVRPQGRSIWRAVGATFLFSMALAASMAWLQGCTGEVWKHRTHLDIATTEIDEVASIGVHCLACNGANLNQGR